MNKKENPIRFKELYYWMQSIVGMLLMVLVLLTFIGGPIGVHGHSMMPTLSAEDRMIVRSIFYTPDRGDIIVFSRSDFQDGTAIVKRVIGLAGDVVDIDTQSGLVYVNGIALYEPYTMEPTHRPMSTQFPFTVPDGHVFVLGDNRNNSGDSRDINLGAIDEREIVGQVVAVVLPFHRARLFLD